MITKKKLAKQIFSIDEKTENSDKKFGISNKAKPIKKIKN